MKRSVEVAVISDTHLGTYGCKAKELLNYLKSIEPKVLILNGDFIDIWQFKKSYFPESHLEIIKYILNLSLNNCQVIYLTGNHDEFLRDRKSTRLNSSHVRISYAVFCLK